jgi:hypothetical protein
MTAFSMQIVPDAIMVQRVVREAHGAWCEGLVGLAMLAREMEVQGHVTQARALREDMRFLVRRAKLHLRKLRSEGDDHD